MSTAIQETKKADLGFHEQTNDGGLFFQVKHNTICIESRTEQVGFKQVEVKNPRTNETIIKWIKPFKSLTAYVTKIEWRDTGDQFEQRFLSWKIYLKAGEQVGVLELPFHSRTSSRFMRLAENLDFSQPVTFRAWRDAKTDSTAFYVGQNEVSVSQKYTKETPGECPVPIKDALTGKWDFSAQNRFLHGQMINQIIPKVESVAAALEHSTASPNNEPEFEETPFEREPGDDSKVSPFEDEVPF